MNWPLYIVSIVVMAAGGWVVGTALKLLYERFAHERVAAWNAWLCSRSLPEVLSIFVIAFGIEALVAETHLYINAVVNFTLGTVCVMCGVIALGLLPYVIRAVWIYFCEAEARRIRYANQIRRNRSQ